MLLIEIVFNVFPSFNRKTLQKCTYLWKNHHYLSIFLVMDHFNNISPFFIQCCWIEAFSYSKHRQCFLLLLNSKRRNSGETFELLFIFYFCYIYFKLVILLSCFKSSTLEHFTKRNQKMLYFVDDAYKAIENCRKFYVSSFNN